MREDVPIEIIRPWQPDEMDIRYALFDFDGTISLIREGWQAIMIPYFCETLRRAGTRETDAELLELVRRFVTDLTGKQTIFQCMRLREEVLARGGEALEPIDYKREYLRRLELRIHSRKERLESGADAPEDWMVPGSREMILALRERGIRCHLASGTDESDVLYEARLLGVDELFDGGIHGAHDAMVECSKELVIRDLLTRDRIAPNQLVSFGDGYVEVELVAKLGGLPVGVATEEETRRGVNAWKRDRLIAAGARAIMADFRRPQAILALIGKEGEPDAVSHL